jgi:hypothetical protein
VIFFARHCVVVLGHVLLHFSYTLEYVTQLNFTSNVYFNLFGWRGEMFMKYFKGGGGTQDINIFETAA